MGACASPRVCALCSAVLTLSRASTEAFFCLFPTLVLRGLTTELELKCVSPVTACLVLEDLALVQFELGFDAAFG